MKTEWIKFCSLLKRNIKLYFADKVMFFTSLIAPLILLLLYILFLRNVFADSLLNVFREVMPEGYSFTNENLPDAFVACWMMASLLSVSCVTVSIGACVVMVQDKLKGVIHDIDASPVNRGTITLAYFAATFCSALLIVGVVMTIGFIYIAFTGWYLSVSDVLLILLNTVLLTLFGCTVAAIINQFVRSDGAVTAVSALSSSVYGFICGAYMPLSQFGAVFSNIFGFNPGLHSAILFRRLFLGGVLDEMSNTLPEHAILAVEEGFDFRFYFFNSAVSPVAMWLVLAASVLVLGALLILIANRKALFRRKSLMKS